MTNLVKILWLGGAGFAALMLLCTIAFTGVHGGYEMGENFEQIWTWRAIFVPLIFVGFFVSFCGMLLAAIFLDK